MSSLSEIIGILADNRLNTVNTAIPGYIIKVHRDKMAVDVQPSINEMDEDGTTRRRPILLDVPYMLPMTENSAVLMPVHEGDFVLVVFGMRSMDNFKHGTGMETKPTDRRQHAIDDGVAIIGLRPFSKSINRPSAWKHDHNQFDLVVVHNLGSATECEIRMSESGNVTVNTDQDFTVNARSITLNGQQGVSIKTPTLAVEAQATTWTGNITHSGNYVQTGVSTFNGIPFHTHIHGGVMPGSGTTAVPQA
ncbi:Gp138 family membrane-puncturing spike protein [Pseudomonas aeruginosa]|uniref:Gp138 family membrane-puncturing spike protein n=2 Tax=Pseudomonas aeruginosa TaxID=287 RepID=UPI000D3BADA5|nr:Gp138 family membrane-puncturing spike protein [Pseudomonas aeruginosa]PUA13565.1 hypothetical protein DB390_13770 [Pseudomonas aeruginosa]WME47967.1 Gp138 family membrane-puncturing spike protein [Pseudomonas aeruginosa]HBO0872975.1 hypothetical protein [Pseudomonas aeruginosa]HBO2119826.1 hypothetical protein [Pseudomonas aeruginosa]HCL3448922.1 hypothetical protein [Pseudomonas aeruginosa]